MSAQGPSGLSPDLFKPCDLRGVYGQELTPEAARIVGRALAAEAGGGRVVVGGDVRPSTPPLMAALVEGLVVSGCEVTDIGIVPTPVLYFAKRALGFESAVMVTASHNPPKYNGVKFMLGDEPTDPAVIERVKRRALTGDFIEGPGRLATADVVPGYEAWLASAFGGDIQRRLRVLVDPGNGCYAEIAPRVLDRAGLDVVELNCRADGTFPNRSPNPSVFANLAGTARAVRESGADFGVAFDGDGDRVILLDGEGRPHESDRVALVFIRHLLPAWPGARVVYDQKCSDAVRAEVERLGGTAILERSGHSFIRKRMMVENALFGAEVSGHFFFRELGFADDGLYAALVLARCFAGRAESVSALMDGLPRPVMSPDIRVPFSESDRRAILAELRRAFAELPQSDLDGVRVQWPSGWALCRESVTEPILTLRFEGRTQEDLAEIMAEVQRRVPKLKGRLGRP